ncbi:MAG: hypothetical protein H3C43_14275, partial [Leptonema sp. (in: Bacteria)]|nr:hypothetical protein [Leptonema sp. (in: bacteria)]
MHDQRFRNNPASRRIDIRGRVSLVHLGRGSFLYTYPGKARPHIGRIDLSFSKIRRHTLMTVVLFSGFFLGFSVFSNAGRALGALNDDHDTTALLDDKNLTPEQFDQKSEDFK